jgi:hypothetical protein
VSRHGLGAATWAAHRAATILRLGVGLAVALGAPPALGAQDGAGASATPLPVPFFDSEEPLPVTFTADLGRLRRDTKDKAPWRPATLAYAGTDGRAVAVPIKARTRGIWRLKNCDFPPLRLNFAAATARGTPFERLDKPKLVTHCRDNTGYEQYVLREHQLYRVLGLLTPVSHRARLVRVTYVDEAGKRDSTTRYAIALEEPAALAARVGGRLLEATGARADDLDPYHAALVGVFQYLIGNSDWSTGALHNAELVTTSTFAVFIVPYDFDFSGAVNAPYATVDPALPIKHVRERIYRGHCASADEYARVFALFNAKKDAIYALYRDSVGRLLEPRAVRETLAYFDEFYATINTPRSARRAIVEACVDRQ